MTSEVHLPYGLEMGEQELQELVTAGKCSSPHPEGFRIVVLNWICSRGQVWLSSVALSRSSRTEPDSMQRCSHLQDSDL